jgi:hypothetical protein
MSARKLSIEMRTTLQSAGGEDGWAAARGAADAEADAVEDA